MKHLTRKPLKSICLICILIFISLAFLKCKKGSTAYISKINGHEVVICPINKVTDTIHLPLSSLVESCEIVQLQTIDDALFDRAWHTEISDNYICIKGYAQIPVKLYDRNGQFLRKIGEPGRGPGEYASLNGLQFNHEGNLLYLFPFGTTRKILAYDVNGNYIKDIPLAFTQRKFKAFFSSDSIITVLSMPFQNDSAICFQQTLDGRLIQKIAPPSYLISQSFDGEVFTNYSTTDFDFFNTATDTLYHYNTVKNILEPKFALDFGEGKKPVSVSRELPGYYYSWISWIIGEDRISRQILVDKKTLDAKYFILKNDFFGGIDASPIFSNGYFINNIAAITLKTQLEKVITNKDLTDQMKQKLIDLNNSLKQDDNNIIFWGRLK